MALGAMLFDVDGTLIDTNAAHLAAWDRALKQHGYTVSADRIAVEVGKGGDKLIPSILGMKIEKHHGESLRKAHTDEFKNIAEATKLSIFPSVEKLVNALRNRGLKLAIATSSSQAELKTTQKSSGIDLAALFDVIATGDDAKDSKPAPGIIQAAVKKLGLSPAACAMVGDTPYDAHSARDAGVICIGFTCGGMNDEEKLRAAGMREVYRNPAAMLDNVDDALAVASPGSSVLDESVIARLMHAALDVAREGMEKGEVPIGCVLARGDGQIVARAHNELNSSQNRTAHAEMVAFNRCSGKLPADARDLILVSTLEPCVMCLGASMEAAVDTIIFALPAPADGGTKRVSPPVSPESQMPRILGDCLADESRKLLKTFLDRSPSNPMQVKFVRQLLSLT